MKLLGDFFRYIENLVSRGDGYYSKIIKFSHIINFIYIMIFSAFGIHILKNQMLHNFNSTIQLLVCGLLKRLDNYGDDIHNNYMTVDFYENMSDLMLSRVSTQNASRQLQEVVKMRKHVSSIRLWSGISLRPTQ